MAEFDPHVRVSVVAPVSGVALSWQAMDNAAGFGVARRPGGAGAWESLADLPGSATTWTDTSIAAGQSHEYRVSRSGSDGTEGVGYVLAGTEVPFPDDIGVIALVVSSSSIAAYAERLPRLENDLRAEGWQVVREEVGSDESPPAVRGRLQALQASAAGRLKAALLLGQVPQPYSGFQNPDGHPEHRGAWPADTYYSDLDGTWTDEQELGGPDTGVLEPPKGRAVPMINRASDGKFDQDQIPSDLDIAVGRVDARDMPGYAPLTASDLENRYLDNNHAYRSGAITFERRTSVTDLLGVFSNNPLARMAYRDGTAVFGAEPEQVGSGAEFFSALESPGGYGMSFAISYGHVDGSDAIGLNQPFKNRMARAFFLGAFGSFFGDWSTTNNLLRDAIFHPGVILGANWCNWPDNHYHQLGALWTVGDTLLVSFNDDHQDQTRSARGKHAGLMGDPSLRLFMIQAPAMLTAAPATMAGGIQLSWQASPAASIRGYHVYRAPSDATGVEQRVTPSPIAETTFVDVTAQPGAAYRYRVVAVELLETGSGTFFNHSPGAMVTTEGTVSGGTGGTGGAAGGPTTAGLGGAGTVGGAPGADPVGGLGSSAQASPSAQSANPATDSCACKAPAGRSLHPLSFVAAAAACALALQRRRRR